jgi:hypothetical protein
MTPRSRFPMRSDLLVSISVCCYYSRLLVEAVYHYKSCNGRCLTVPYLQSRDFQLRWRIKSADEGSDGSGRQYLLYGWMPTYVYLHGINWHGPWKVGCSYCFGFPNVRRTSLSLTLVCEPKMGSLLSEFDWAFATYFSTGIPAPRSVWNC